MRENNSTCFKCGGIEDLRTNAKYVRKDGAITYTYLCRPCNTERQKRYRQTDSGRAAIARRAARVQALMSPEKRFAYLLVNREVQSGRLKPQPCFVCNTPKTQAHHEDYSRPLDIVWLCTVHHSALHRERRAAKRAA